MKAEILSIGSELTAGQSLDTNSQWLSLRLAEVGIPVGWHTTIADDIHDNIEAFKIASQRAGLVIVTGGLGPTQDDLTREVLAKLAGVELVFDQKAMDNIQAMFARRNRPMPERNRVQAYLPQGAESLFNELGTAPGIWIEIGKAAFAAMPGVPSEMFQMFHHQVKPRLERLGLSKGVRVQRKINTFGSGESQIEEKVLDFTHRDHIPEVGITASDAVIALRIFGHGESIDAARKQVAPIEKAIVERLGDLVYGYDEEELEDAVIRMLAAKNLSLSTAESVTAGLVANRLARVPGASESFKGGIVAYTNAVKTSHLHVEYEVLNHFGAVSAEVAEAMAIGCRAQLGTDFALATTGYAGPTTDDPAKPVGLVYIGLAWNGGASSYQYNWGGTRQEIQSRTAKLALNRLRLKLLET